MARLFTVGLLLICININAQTPAIEWHKCLGSNFSEYAQCVQPTSDGGFIVSGSSGGLDNGDVMGHHGFASGGDIWVVKLDKSGAIEWQKNLGGSDNEEGGYIIQTPDGGYMVAGGGASRDCGVTGNHGQHDFWVIKLNSKGDMVWQKMYGGSKSDRPSSISPGIDGSYYVAGTTESSDGDVTLNHGGMDYWIIKIDAAGNLLWQKSLGGTDFDNASSVQATKDGGCIVAGTTLSSDGDVTGKHGANDFWIVKLDKTGNIQWQKALGGSMTELAECIQLTTDGGYIVAGSAISNDGDVSGIHGTGFDAWIVKLDQYGNIEWQKCYGGSDYEIANYIQNTADGGYVFAGYSNSPPNGDITCNAGHYDLLVMKINKAGVVEWQKTMGGVGFDGAYCIQPLNDGSFIIAASTSSPDIAGYHTPDGGIYDDKSDYWVIKLSAPMATAPAPVVKIDPAASIVCAGKQATISASVLYGGVNPTYQWMKNGMPAGTNSPFYTDLNFNDGDQVSCVVKNGNVCENGSLQGSDMISIKRKTDTQNPEIKISADNTAACACATITIKAMVSNAGGSPNYQWMVNGNKTGSNAPMMISTHLKAGDVITCSYTDNTNCSANGSVLSNAIKMGGSGTAPSLTIVAATDTICKGSTVTFTANPVNAGANPVYQWKVNNINKGTNDPAFSVSTLSDGDIINCSIKTNPLFTCTTGQGANSNNIVMHVMDKLVPSLNISTPSETICAGSLVTFNAVATGAGNNPGYQWKINGVNTGTNDKVYASSSLANNDFVSCVLSISPLYSCATVNQVVSKNIPITVTTGTVPSVEITADKNNVCAGEDVTFTAIANDAGSNPTYQWLLNNALLQAGTPVYTSNKLANGDQLLCKIVPGAGACSFAPDSSNVLVAVIKDTPVVYISPADTIIARGMQVQLNSMIVGNTVSYQWNPGHKLTNPLSLNPQTSILNENTSYSLTVSDDKGCKATANAVIKIGTGLYMPNAFTPNNDGVNDVFRIPPNAILDLKEFSIYDRWGNKIFTTTNKNAGWNGTLNGKKQNTATYVYYIKCIVDHKYISIKGSFILIN
jgi:gliding motility-associated-like protein